MSNNEIIDPQAKGSAVVAGYYRGVYIPKFVRDLVLKGQGRIIEICNQHRVDDKLFAEIYELPFFKKEMREIRALAEASPNALLQLKARELVDEGLAYMFDIVKMGADKDKIKAMEFLSKLGGLYGTGNFGTDNDNGKPQASGLVLNVNLGAGGLIPPLPVGAHRPLRHVEDVKFERVEDTLDLRDQKGKKV